MLSKPRYSSRELDALRDHVQGVADAKRGQSITVCLSTRNDESCIGDVVAEIRREAMDHVRLVDEVIVVDRGSTDRTVDAARCSGALVLAGDSTTEPGGPSARKGEAMRRSIRAASGDIAVLLDVDQSMFTVQHVADLVLPLLTDEQVVLVRAIQETQVVGASATGGHIAELIARPAIQQLIPELAHIRQPLGGDQAARVAEVADIDFEDDHGGGVGLLIDVARRWGVKAISQVRLGARVHPETRNEDLYDEAIAVIRAIRSRAGQCTDQATFHMQPGHHYERSPEAQRVA